MTPRATGFDGIAPNLKKRSDLLKVQYYSNLGDGTTGLFLASGPPAAKSDDPVGKQISITINTGMNGRTQFAIEREARTAEDRYK